MKIKLSVELTGIGSAIKQARELNRMTQKELGELTKKEWTASRISEIENETINKSSINLEEVIELEKNLSQEVLSFKELVKAVIQNYENLKE